MYIENMSPIIRRVLHSAKLKERLNILVLPYDGAYEEDLPEHNLYIYPELSSKRWKGNTEKKGIYTEWLRLKNNSINLPEHVLLDCVLCNDFRHLKITNDLFYAYGVPHILVVHESPKGEWNRLNMGKILKRQRVVFASEEIMLNWGIKRPIISQGDNFQKEWNNYLREMIGGLF